MVAFALRSEPKKAPKRGGGIKARRAVGCWLLAVGWGSGSGCGLWARPCLPLYCCINIYYIHREREGEREGERENWTSMKLGRFNLAFKNSGYILCC